MPRWFSEPLHNLPRAAAPLRGYCEMAMHSSAYLVGQGWGGCKLGADAS